MYKCWICLDIIKNPKKICNCFNNFSYAHKKCIERWVLYSNNITCKFCSSKYEISYSTYFEYQKKKFIKLFKYYLYKFNIFCEYCIDNRVIY